MYTHKLNLDLNARPNSITMYVKQGDTSRKLEATITADGVNYDLAGCTAVLRVDDATTVQDVTESTNVVTLTVPGTETPGLKCGDIAIFKEGTIISTANIKVKVIKSPNNGEV